MDVRKRVARSIQSIDAANKVNSHLIKWLFNQSIANPKSAFRNHRPNSKTLLMNNKDNNILSSLISKTVDRNEIYQKVVDEFLKVKTL